MLLMIDNYDSFTYNLVHYFEMLGQEVCIHYNDKISLSDIETLQPAGIILSPGPKSPSESGMCLAILEAFHQTLPILGVCLGHQCLGQVFGMSVIKAPQIMHGKTSLIEHQNKGLFKGLPDTFSVARYHSLVLDPDTLPACLEISAWTNNTIMAIQHRDFPLYGLQFHPEAILSEQGFPILEHFLHETSQRHSRTTDNKRTLVHPAS